MVTQEVPYSQSGGSIGQKELDDDTGCSGTHHEDREHDSTKK